MLTHNFKFIMRSYTLKSVLGAVFFLLINCYQFVDGSGWLAPAGITAVENLGAGVAEKLKTAVVKNPVPADYNHTLQIRDIISCSSWQVKYKSCTGIDNILHKHSSFSGWRKNSYKVDVVLTGGQEQMMRDYGSFQTYLNTCLSLPTDAKNNININKGLAVVSLDEITRPKGLIWKWLPKNKHRAHSVLTLMIRLPSLNLPKNLPEELKPLSPDFSGILMTVLLNQADSGTVQEVLRDDPNAMLHFFNYFGIDSFLMKVYKGFIEPALRPDSIGFYPVMNLNDPDSVNRVKQAIQESVKPPASQEPASVEEHDPQEPTLIRFTVWLSEITNQTIDRLIRLRNINISNLEPNIDEKQMAFLIISGLCDLLTGNTPLKRNHETVVLKNNGKREHSIEEFFQYIFSCINAIGLEAVDILEEKFDRMLNELRESFPSLETETDNTSLDDLSEIAESLKKDPDNMILYTLLDLCGQYFKEKKDSSESARKHFDSLFKEEDGINPSDLKRRKDVLRFNSDPLYIVNLFKNTGAEGVKIFEKALRKRIFEQMRNKMIDKMIPKQAVKEIAFRASKLYNEKSLESFFRSLENGGKTADPIINELLKKAKDRGFTNQEIKSKVGMACSAIKAFNNDPPSAPVELNPVAEAVTEAL
ncbi:MAG: hypothetical protein ABII23_00630 [bacterium]